MDDISTEMSDSLSRSGKGGMTAALQLADGTVTSPGLTFVSDANSGLYRIAADNIGMSVGGVKIVDYANGAFSFVDTAVTATVGPIFSIFRDSASPADADFIGDLRFDGEDSAGNKTTYSSISSQIDDVTDGTEDGTLLVNTMTAGTLTTQLDVSSAAVVVTPPTTLTGAVTATGGITSGGDILSDTDSTDSLGSTTVRWLKGWFDTLTAGTLTIGGGTITDSSGAISFGNENLTTTGNVDANGVEFDSLSGTGAVAITDILDEDNMASNSATMLATQQSIKAYVDAQVDTADTLSEVLAIGNTTGGTDVSVTTTDKVQFRDAGLSINSSVDGQLDIAADVELQIVAPTVDLNGALDVSTTALVTGVLTTTATQVATGGITSGSNILSDTDSTDSLGSTTVRWLKGWFDTLTAGTLTIGGGTITDSSGAISFGNENLVTTGTLGSGALTATTIAGTTGTFSGDVAVDTDTLFVDVSTDRVGVNIATPATPIHVNRADDGGIALFRRATTNAQIEMGVTSGDIWINGGNGNGLILRTNAVDAITLDTSQNATFSGDVLISGENTITGAITLPLTGEAKVGGSSTLGMVIAGKGSSTDFLLANAAGQTVLTVPTGTTNTTFSGDVEISTLVEPTLNIKNTDTSIVLNQVVGALTFEKVDGSGGGVGIASAIRCVSGSSVGGILGLNFYTSAGTNDVLAMSLDGNQNTTFSGKVNINGGSFTSLATNGTASIYADASHGVFMHGRGSVHDMILMNGIGQTVMSVPTGTQNATFEGSISKASGSFKIPHPLPELNETHNLVHSFVESPRAENLYSGMTNLVDGTASVNIDTHSGMTEGTFEALNTLLTHSSSNESGYNPVKCSVVNNVITINCQDATSTDKVYWEVRGERKDAHMLDTEWTDDAGHVIVEPLKEVVEEVVENV
jgi:hypothetical protein